MYRVFWENKKTGETNYDPGFYELEEAENMVIILNRIHVGIFYRYALAY